MRLAPGVRLGPYEILAPLGTGGMGEVYRAHDPKLDRTVAIKVLSVASSADEGAHARFVREAKTIAALSHPNILAIHDIGVQDGQTYAVMELLDGQSLAQHLERGPLPLDRVIAYAIQIARGLSAAHDQGIVHRDIKPANIFVTRDGHVKLLDFGIAGRVRAPVAGSGTDTRTATDAAMEATTSSDVAGQVGATPHGRAAPTRDALPASDARVVRGTISYMAPEQLRGGDAIDGRADLFAFGATMYEMLTGRRLFQRATQADTIAAILQETAPPADAAIPASMHRLLRRCLEKEPDARFRSAADLAFSLEVLAGGTGGDASAPPADAASSAIATDGSAESAARAAHAATSPRRSGRARTIRIVGAAAVALVAMAAALYLAYRAGHRTALEQRVATAANRTPSFQRLTFRRGNILAARFSPDGRTIVYGTNWTDRPAEIFIARTDGGEAKPFGLKHADVLAVSRNGELAVAQGPYLAGTDDPGQLARVHLGGGAPRSLAENIVTADWAPNGEDLAIVRRMPDGRSRLEFPIGRVLHEAYSITGPRISPDGTLIACADGGSTPTRLLVLDAKTGAVRLERQWRSMSRPLWSPSGAEILVATEMESGTRALRALDLAGHERILHSHPASSFALHDITADGRLLVESFVGTIGIRGRAQGDAEERDLSWRDWSIPTALSGDGRQLLFQEAGQGASAAGDIYLRPMDGSPPIRIGDGLPQDLSADARWALAIQAGTPANLVRMPVGAGQPVRMATLPATLCTAWFVPGSMRVLVGCAPPREPVRVYLVDEDTTLRPVDHLNAIAADPTDGVHVNRGFALSPDGSRWAYVGVDGRIRSVPLFTPAKPTAVGPMLEPYEVIVQWGVDGRHIYTQVPGPVARIQRTDVASGARTPWKELRPADPAGVLIIGPGLKLARDGQSYAFGYYRVLTSDLFLVSGLDIR